MSEHFKYEAMMRSEKAQLGIGTDKELPFKFLADFLNVNDDRF